MRDAILIVLWELAVKFDFEVSIVGKWELKSLRFEESSRRRKELLRKDRLIMQGNDVIRLQKLGDSQTDVNLIKEKFGNVSRLQYLRY